MDPLVLLAILFAAPILLIFLTKANAAIVFLALCAGNVLQTYIGDDALAVVQGLANNYSPAFGQYIKLAIMLAPVLLAVLFLHGSVQGGKFMINLIPAIAVGASNVFLSVPLLPDELQSSIYGTAFWAEFSAYQTAIIGGSVLVSMFVILSGKRGHGKKGKKKHRK